MTPDAQRWARVFLTLLLIPLGVRAFGSEYGEVPLVSWIDLAVHEFGHALFMPFGIPVLGETMVILGGSLFQIVFPLIFLWYFAYGPKQHRDAHAATICLWWASMNVLSVAIYVGDARARELMLISGSTGQEDDGHDWYNLLSQWGTLSRDTIYAARLRALAGLMFATSILAGLWSLARRRNTITNRETPTA